ncbi:MAG: hypothetical protein GY711_33065 [bacterium]|nr:hypothetical protein [bacterium]
MLIDQRGTGGSNQWQVRLPGSDEDLQGYFEPFFQPEVYAPDGGGGHLALGRGAEELRRSGEPCTSWSPVDTTSLDRRCSASNGPSWTRAPHMAWTSQRSKS